MGTFTLARDGGISSANLAGGDVLGVPRARLLGRRFGAFFPLAERQAFDAFLARTLEDTRRESCGVTLEPGSGGRRIARVEATASPAGKEGRVALLDVTEQRAAEAEIRRMNEGPETAVDLAAPCREILAELASASPDRSAQAVVPEKLLVRGDPRLLRPLLENLLGERLEVHGGDSGAADRGRFTGRVASRVDLFVRDNGPGFDMSYVGKLLQRFQRLHSENRYPGTGIGLAIVAMIANRHGGVVRAEGAQGTGATFFVRLPAGDAVA